MVCEKGQFCSVAGCQVGRGPNKGKPKIAQFHQKGEYFCREHQSTRVHHEYTNEFKPTGQALETDGITVNVPTSRPTTKGHVKGCWGVVKVINEDGEKGSLGLKWYV